VKGRKCPHCGNKAYSADALTNWKCPKCGSTIPKDQVYFLIPSMFCKVKDLSSRITKKPAAMTAQAD